MAGKPLWRRAFDGVDRRIAGPVERAARSDAFGDRPPVVIVHSLVSRSYVLDLYPGNSAIAFLLAQGLDVYLLDWGVADEAEAANTLETYARGYIPEALAALDTDVTLLGYCFGGVL